MKKYFLIFLIMILVFVIFGILAFAIVVLKPDISFFIKLVEMIKIYFSLA